MLRSMHGSGVGHLALRAAGLSEPEGSLSPGRNITQLRMLSQAQVYALTGSAKGNLRRRGCESQASGMKLVLKLATRDRAYTHLHA
eukprot:scaffold7202_cov403-Prasinococcus_capsulatus_cf.AAC.10